MLLSSRLWDKAMMKQVQQVGEGPCNYEAFVLNADSGPVYSGGTSTVRRLSTAMSEGMIGWSDPLER